MDDQKNINKDMELLIQGKEAFPAILDEIRAARHSICICMFVWRDDKIGRKIAVELLKAAERGVKIEIIKDRNGIFFEYSEEDQSSFFHKDLSLIDIIKINAMKIMYQPGLLFKPFARNDEELLNRMKAHPNIIIRSDEYHLDHSKYYIFDDQTIITGGINIEDKENGSDIHGIEYIDYMIRIRNKEAVKELRKALENGPGEEDGIFAINVPGYTKSGIARAYLKIIDDAQKELSIIVSYIMPIKEIMDAFKRALDRGIKIRLLIPKRSNYLNHSNRYTAKMLAEYANKNGGDLQIYLSDKMTHIKALVSDNHITIGSANITGKSLGRQGELNIFVQNDQSDFARAVNETFNEIFESATPVDPKQLKYSKIVVFMEKTVMS